MLNTQRTVDFIRYLVDHVSVGSQANFVSELLEANVAILLGSVWLVAQLVSLQSSLVCGTVATHITLEGMLAGVDLGKMVLKQ